MNWRFWKRKEKKEEEERERDEFDEAASARSSKEDMTRLLRDHLRPLWRRILLILMLALFTSMGTYIFGYMSKLMVDEVLQIGVRAPEEQASTEEGSTVAPSTSDANGEASGSVSEEEASKEEPPRVRIKSVEEKTRLLGYMALAYIAIRLLFIGFDWLYSYQTTYTGQRIIFRLRSQLHEKLQQLQMTFFDQQQTGKLMARIMDDVGIIQSSVSGVFVTFLTQVARLIVGIVVLLRLNAELSVFAFLMFPFYMISYEFYIRKIRPINRRNREVNSEVYGLIVQAISGIRVVKSFGQERMEVRRFFHKVSEYIRLQLKSTIYGNTLGYVSSFVSLAGTMLIFYYGARKVQAGVMTYGEFTFFSSSVGSLFGPVHTLTYMGSTIQWVLIAVKRVFHLLDLEVTIKDAPDAIDVPEMEGRVEFRDVTLRYESADDDALRHISFEAPAGSVICLVGPSGSGKSSLVNMLLRLYDATEGQILIDGIDITKIRLHDLRNHIRMVPQEPILFSGTLAENIVYGQIDATAQEIVQAARSAELHDFVMTLPEKYETRIGERGTSLSGGQKQRLAFAMALITNPSVLILDDSTSALDAETEAKIQKTLNHIMENRTTFIITHRISTAMKGDLILVLDKGELVEKGSHSELLEHRGLYYDIFDQQYSRRSAEA